MKGYLEQTYFLRAADTDVNGEWRASSILMVMQEAGGAQSEGYGLGMAALREQNLAWVVSRTRMHMGGLPTIGQTVTVRTWPKPPHHAFFPRYFQFFVDGEAVGSAVSLYVQLDLTTRRMVKPWLGNNVELECALESPMPMPGNIPTSEVAEQASQRVVCYSDLDVNEHVNNTRYLDWFCDCFTMEHHHAWALQDVLIHYNREIRAQEQVELSLRHVDGQSILRGSCDGVQCFAISGVWQKR